MRPKLAARGVGLTKGGVRILVESGTFLVLIGSSGVGKSTLLNLLAGLEAPTGSGGPTSSGP